MKGLGAGLEIQVVKEAGASNVPGIVGGRLVDAPVAAVEVVLLCRRVVVVVGAAAAVRVVRSGAQVRERMEAESIVYVRLVVVRRSLPRARFVAASAIGLPV